MPFRFCALALAAALLLPAAPASAHPFGPPSTALISADGSRVALSWRAAEDDWVALGQSLGAFEDPAAGPVSTELTGEQKLGRSPAVRDYLLDRIALSQHGRPCPGRIAPLENLLAEGARLTFDCPAPVTEVEVTLKTLTDLNTAYRTVLTAETPAVPAQALFTAAASTHRLRFTESAAGPPAAALPIAGAALGGLSVLVLATVWVGVSGAGGYATETVTAWMQVGVGVVVIAVGVHLTWRHLRGRSAVGHGHGHGHGHHGDVDPWSRRGLVALALAGGLLPSPSAFLVLVSGLLTGRSGGAVILVLAFGTGMAVTLTGVGVATISGYGLLTGRPRMAALTARMPLLAGLAVSAGGVVYLVAAAGALA